MSSLLSLPTETIHAVCDFLDKSDVVQLRMTCKEMKDKSYGPFMLKHLRHQKIMMTRESIQAMIDFSNKVFGADNRKLGTCIRELSISVASFPEADLRWLNGLPLAGDKEDTYRFWPGDTAKVEIGRIYTNRRKAHAQYLHEQRTLRKRCEGERLLAELLSTHLTGVHTINIVPAVRTFPPGVEPPRGVMAADRSLYPELPWGMDSVHRKTGNIPSRATDFHQEFTQWIIAATLTAISKTSIKLKAFVIRAPFTFDFAIPPNKKKRSTTPIPSMTLSDATFEELRGPFANLRTLEIHADRYYRYSRADPKSIAWLSRFISIAPNVEDFTFACNDNSMTQFLAAMGSGSTRSFPYLRKLSLSSGTISYGNLVDLFTASVPNVEEVKLNELELHTPSKRRAWDEVLHILEDLPFLTRVEISEASGGGDNWGSYQWLDRTTKEIMEKLVLEAKDGKGIGKLLIEQAYVQSHRR